MNAPMWLNAVLREFGEMVGLSDFGLSSHDVTTVKFENGIRLSFEYAFESLAVILEVPCQPDQQAMKRLLSYAAPDRRPRFRLRTAYLEKRSMGMLVARLPEREVTLPVLNSVFTDLWRLAEDFRRWTS